MKIVLIISQVLILFSFNNCELNNENLNYAEELISKIESFKTIEHRLPNEVSELGLKEKMDDLAFYQLTSDSTYQIWYGLSLGESNIYSSETKQWSNNR